MPLERQQLAIGALIAWLFTILFFMVLSTYLDLELFFALGFIGILIIAELTDTVYAKPLWLLRMRYVIAAGVVIFAFVVARKVLEILGS
jgi:hypothetical protein